MTTVEDMESIIQRMVPVDDDAVTDLETLERTLDRLEREGMLIPGSFDPLRYDDVDIDIYANQNIPEGK